jgi:HNH endonuclease
MIAARLQRDHDALEEACRLLAAGGLPDTAGQPTQIQLHMTLSQLRDLAAGSPAAGGTGAGADGAGPEQAASPAGGGAGGWAEDAWLAARGTAAGVAGWLSDAAADGYACDAAVTPVVTGHIDRRALDELTAALGGQDRQKIESLIIGSAAGVLSGPGGLAAFLRAGLDGTRLALPSLPLDVGQADKIPAYLRRLVMVRHPRCGFPGCRRRARQCQVHHIIPRSEGGPAALGNLISLCSFHHLIAIHRWGWKLALNPDGTTTVTSPDGHRTRHSHGPPTAAAA